MMGGASAALPADAAIAAIMLPSTKLRRPTKINSWHAVTDHATHSLRKMAL